MKFIGKICLVVLLTSCTQKVCNDQVACQKVEDGLTAIENSVKHKESDPLRTIEAVHFFNVLTGIESQSWGDDVGQYNPTREDYEKWSQWYENNKDKLYWDKESKSVRVRK